MAHLKRLTSQQLVVAASCATLTGGVLVSRHQVLGVSVLVIAALCGLGAYAKSRNS